MRKHRKFAAVFILIISLAMLCVVIADKQKLRSDLIRLHVVADSDSEADQAIKLQVRDAVLACINDGIEQVSNADAAKAYLQTRMPELESAANAVLLAAGSEDRAQVTLCEEEFPVRHYESFSLPSGVYESLRVTIGSGEGKNWWCVVFPSLCISAASEDFRATAVSSGFSESLSKTLSGEEHYEISFFFLDCLGKLENFFHFG